MRQYDDPIDVRRGMVAGHDAPEQFIWRDTLWLVRQILAYWVRTGAWWEQDDPAGMHAEREVWRVEAGRGSAATAGVFDLSFDWGDGRWRLVRCFD